MNRLTASVVAVVALAAAAPAPEEEATAKLVIEDAKAGDSRVFLQNPTRSFWIEVAQSAGSRQIRRWKVESSGPRAIILTLPERPSSIQVLYPDGTAVYSATRTPDGGVPAGAEARRGTWIGNPFQAPRGPSDPRGRLK